MENALNIYCELVKRLENYGHKVQLTLSTLQNDVPEQPIVPFSRL